MGTWLPTQAVTMKSFVLSSLFAVGLSAPTTHVNSGLPAGPLTPAFGDAVQTPKGLRSLALEGFSEDLNQDGFVDPIGQAVVAQPVVYAHPQVVAAPNVVATTNVVATPHVVAAPNVVAATRTVVAPQVVSVKTGTVPASTQPLVHAVHTPVVAQYAATHHVAAPVVKPVVAQYAAQPVVQPTVQYVNP